MAVEVVVSASEDVVAVLSVASTAGVDTSSVAAITAAAIHWSGGSVPSIVAVAVWETMLLLLLLVELVLVLVVEGPVVMVLIVEGLLGFETLVDWLSTPWVLVG